MSQAIARRPWILLLSCLLFFMSGIPSFGGEVDQDMPITGISHTLSVDQFTGQLTGSIPIAIPPGRNGMQPNLALTYSSANGNGWVGVGWKLEMGVIERQSRFGVNYTTDDYTLRLNGISQDLVKKPVDDGYFWAKIESTFTQVQKITSPDNSVYFMAWDRIGRTYRFGSTAAARVANPTNAAQIFRWHLDQIMDPDGNYVALTYAPDPGTNETYLVRIDYTGNQNTGAATTNYVKFYREARPDPLTISLAGFTVQTNSRLKTIEVQANGTLYGVYRLSYAATNTYTNRSVLASVRQYDKDAVITQTPGQTYGDVTGLSLPPLTFTTSAPPLRSPYFTDTCNSSSAPGVYCSGNNYLINIWWTEAFTSLSNVSLGDVSGDGLPDLVKRVGTAFYVTLGTGASGFSSGLWSGVGFQGTGMVCASQYPFTLADMNGDGLADLVCADSQQNMWVAFSQGMQTGTVQFAVQPTWGRYSIGPFADFNADGKADLVAFQASSLFVAVLMNTGSGFGPQQNWTFNGWCGGSGQWGGFADVNGDGLIDLYCGNTTSGVYVALGTGSTFVPTPDLSTPWLAGPLGTTSPGIVGDVNGDGRADLVLLDVTNNGISETAVALSFGMQFLQPQFAGQYGPGYFCGSQYSSEIYGIADLTGDGKGDLYCFNVNDGIYVAASDPSFGLPDLLASVNNGLGGTTTVSYLPSTQAQTSTIPFVLPIVSMLSVNDGNPTVNNGQGTTSTTRYTYSGGFYYGPEKDFRGFNSVMVTNPRGGQTTTLYHQGNDLAVNQNTPNVPTGYLKGKPYRTINTDMMTGGETQVTYTADPDNLAPWFTPPAQVDEIRYQFETTNAGKTRRTVFYYDRYGNVSREDQYGDLADSTDDRTVTRGFWGVNSATTYIVGLPFFEAIYQGIPMNAVLASTNFYYDGNTSASGTGSCSQATGGIMPSKGHVTRVVRSLMGGTSPETWRAYDAYGNVLCTRDPNNNVTTVNYDTVASTFPVAVTNALNQTVKTQYYGVNPIAGFQARGFYGQLQVIWDANTPSNGRYREYDTFGRVTYQGGGPINPITITYNNFGGGVGTQNVQQTAGMPTMLTTTTFFDGLGRLITTQRTGPSGKLIVTDTQYDVGGAVAQQTLPYFQGTESATGRWRSYKYDTNGNPWPSFIRMAVGPSLAPVSGVFPPSIRTGIIRR